MNAPALVKHNFKLIVFASLRLNNQLVYLKPFSKTHYPIHKVNFTKYIMNMNTGSPCLILWIYYQIGSPETFSKLLFHGLQNRC